ncbi:uncharacterized protein TNIN_15501, partial [Trichonephila inaurata madagascariensis]
ITQGARTSRAAGTRGATATGNSSAGTHSPGPSTTGWRDTRTLCRKTRDDFNCLMWQTSNCLNREERDRDNDIFRRARDFISRNCDTYGRWTENNCYKTTEMQRCEALVSNTRGGANYESCRGFLSFRDCMSDELMRRCTREDDLYQGAYLVDKAQEMSWQCGTTDQYNGRNQYSTFDRKYDQYDRPQDNYDNNNSPLHLEDEGEVTTNGYLNVGQLKDFVLW